MLEDNLNLVKQQVLITSQKSNNKKPKIIAVSKKHSDKSIREVFNLGQIDFGENFLQEALEKQQKLTDLNIIWHYIGSIQSNKTKKITENFSWVHTVCSLKIAQRLSNQRPISLKPLNICLQINIDEEESKSGFIVNSSFIGTVEQISKLENINLKGLMVIPNPSLDTSNAFEKTKNLLNKINNLLNLETKLETLSMGMSSDLKQAITEGATMVRIGTAIFGERNYD